MTVVVFFAIVLGISFCIFLLPSKTFSEIENHNLATAPDITLQTLMDGSFMRKAETFIADQLTFRGNLTAVQTKLELLSGRREIEGVFVSDRMLLENIEPPNMEVTKGNIDAINQFAQKYESNLSTQVMLVPTALEFYKQQVPDLAQVMKQTEYIKATYDKLYATNTIDAYSAFVSSKNDYIFYRTDQHWTSFGAYTGYSALAKPLGFKTAAIDMFNVEHASHNFLGNLYSKILYNEELVDTIDLYHYAPGEVVTEVIKYTQKNTQTYSSIFFREYLDEKEQYSVFMGENAPVMKINTNVENGKKIIIFKDSYAHALMQFLPLHYEEILLVDLRYLHQPLEEYANILDYQQALFLYSVDSFSKDGSVKQVGLY